MPRQKPRYWVYTHDEQDEIIDTVGEYDVLTTAIMHALAEMIDLTLEGETAVTVRVVDSEADSTTIWWAGPKPREESMYDVIARQHGDT